jgi:hypothetical protein
MYFYKWYKKDKTYATSLGWGSKPGSFRGAAKNAIHFTMSKPHHFGLKK